MPFGAQQRENFAQWINIYRHSSWALFPSRLSGIWVWRFRSIFHVYCLTSFLFLSHFLRHNAKSKKKHYKSLCWTFSFGINKEWDEKVDSVFEHILCLRAVSENTLEFMAASAAKRNIIFRIIMLHKFATLLSALPPFFRLHENCCTQIWHKFWFPFSISFD